MLTVTVPADDPSVITIATLRVANGYAASDASHDAAIIPIGLRVTAEIAAACNIAIGKSDDWVPPTLRRETLVETFRRPRSGSLVLSRRHHVEVDTIAIDDDAVATEDFEVDPESGLLHLFCDGRRRAWYGDLVTVTYDAGFEEIPADLDAAAGELVGLRLSEAGRDPTVKSIQTSVPDVLDETTSYWIGAVPGQTSAGMPDDVFSRLSRYRNMPVR